MKNNIRPALKLIKPLFKNRSRLVKVSSETWKLCAQGLFYWPYTWSKYSIFSTLTHEIGKTNKLSHRVILKIRLLLILRSSRLLFTRKMKQWWQNARAPPSDSWLYDLKRFTSTCPCLSSAICKEEMSIRAAFAGLLTDWRNRATRTFPNSSRAISYQRIFRFAALTNFASESLGM